MENIKNSSKQAKLACANSSSATTGNAENCGGRYLVSPPVCLFVCLSRKLKSTQGEEIALSLQPSSLKVLHYSSNSIELHEKSASHLNHHF